MFSNIEDELCVFVKHEEFWQVMMFSDVCVEEVSDFFYFHRDDED